MTEALRVCDPHRSIYVGAALPMDPHEIDAHPDAARIWATVRAMNATLDVEEDASLDETMDEALDAAREGLIGEIEELVVTVAPVGDERLLEIHVTNRRKDDLGEVLDSMFERLADDLAEAIGDLAEVVVRAG